MITVSYLNDPTLKANFLAEIAKHEAADAIVQGTYGEIAANALGFRGCAIGCALHSLCTLAGHPEVTDDRSRFQDHSRYVTELGISLELAYLEDQIFENLPIEDESRWGALNEQLESIPEWARTWAWAWAWARTWAGAWARTWAGAGARTRAGAGARTRAVAGAWAWAVAGARAEQEYYQALSAEVLRVLQAARPL